MQGTLAGEIMRQQYDAYRNLQDVAQERARAEIAAADSRVGRAREAFHLVSNWGNAESKAALQRYYVLRSKLYNRKHREFIRLEKRLYPERKLSPERWR